MQPTCQSRHLPTHTSHQANTLCNKRDVKHVPFYPPILHAQLPPQGKLTHYRYKPRAWCPTLSTCFSAVKCNIQYVGETSQQLNERINSHRSDIRRKSKVNQLLLFSNYPATQLTNSVMLIDQLFTQDTVLRKICKKCWINISVHEFNKILACMRRIFFKNKSLLPIITAITLMCMQIT